MARQGEVTGLIDAILEQRGWKQDDLARELGVSQQAVSRWRNPPYPTPRPDLLYGLQVLAETRPNERKGQETARRAERGRSPEPRRKRVVIVGAGFAGTFLVKELKEQEPPAFDPVAFVDDQVAENPTGVPVADAIAALPRVVASQGADEVIIAAPAAGATLVRKVVSALEDQPVAIRLLPRSAIGARRLRPRLRPVDIRDLITPAPIMVHADVAEMIQGKTVLVTGAGDWFGAALAAEIQRFAPKRLLLADVFGTQLDAVQEELGSNSEAILADLAYAEVLTAVKDRIGSDPPTVVFHAGGHHGTRALEQNGCEAVRTNFCGIKNLLDLLQRVDSDSRITHIVRVSSATAATPTSWMGTSSLLGERLLAARCPAGAKAFSIRFGSLTNRPRGTVERFEEALKSDKPLRIPSALAQRSFLTTEHAVALTLTAAALNFAESAVAVNVGITMNLQKIAEHMIKLSGVISQQPPEIRPTGATPHDQLYQPLIRSPEEWAVPIEGSQVVQDEEEHPLESTNALVGIAWNDELNTAVDEQLDEIVHLVGSGSTGELAKRINGLIDVADLRP